MHTGGKDSRGSVLIISKTSSCLCGPNVTNLGGSSGLCSGLSDRADSGIVNDSLSGHVSGFCCGWAIRNRRRASSHSVDLGGEHS